MSIHIDGNEYDTGTRYNGTWNFTKSIQGNFQLVYQDFSLGDIPWCYSGCDTFEMQDPNNLPAVTTITFPEISSTDSTSIRAWFTTAFNTAGWVTVSSSSYDSATNQYTFNLSAQILARYDPAYSTIAYVFNWVSASPLSGNPTNQLVIDGKYFTNDPKYLYVFSSQIKSKLDTSNFNRPSFIISTQDNFVSGQDIFVKTATQTLNLGIYRVNVPIAAVPLDNEFDMIFTPI